MANEPRALPLERELFLRSLNMSLPSRNVARQLSQAMRDESFRAGQTIYEAGQVDGLLHFVVEGEVELTAPGAAPWRFKAPAIVGVIDVIHHRPYTRSAVARTDVRALAMRESDWFEVIEENYEFAQQSILRLAADVHRLHLELSPSGGFPPPRPAGDVDPHALNLMERTLALRAVTIFRHASVQGLAILAFVSAERELPRGGVLCRRGDPAPSFFVVTGGTVRAERSSPDMLVRFGPGSIVGGECALGLAEQAYDVTAESPTLLLEISRDDLFDVLEDHVDMVRIMLAGLATEREHILKERAEREKGALMERG